ncbi:cytochrome c oxidase assembly protein [Jatrophihabitans telluris]|uniref:Cytochrome c oxidase assembly protein n=1 Tax=Jatrophihabitans telluris TaxID=2038343 RepID=A0ABY4QZ04_9ACTN|nr:cytochrome c oxidase assembly protein [Jatrophihabitans telluris]UQX88074.1 cytochrome c oxidase assembly protein [Jatrophihabitans telluris]
MWSVWLLALTILAGLVAAVVRYLSMRGSAAGTMDAGSGGSGAMHHGQAADALLRMGAGNDLGQLLGTSLLRTWQLDSIAVAFVVLAAAAYLTAVLKVHRTMAWSGARTALFLAGLAVCVVCTCASIGVYDMALYSAHMLGHLGFVMVAPALLMAGRPIELALLALSESRRLAFERFLQGRFWTVFTAPPVALASYAVVIVGSHLTGLMDTIMTNPWAGQVEHLVYLVIGSQFFLLILGDTPGRWQLSTPARWLMLALSMAVDTFVGIVIMQGSTPVRMLAVPGLSVNTLSDTHTGGAIMWFGGDGIMAAIMIGLVLGWLNDPERRKHDSSGWLEQARRVSFDERTGAGGSPASAADDLDFDDEDSSLNAYNAYLAKLNGDAAGSEHSSSS